MSESSWVCLTTRFGADINNPSVDDVDNALLELFITDPALTEDDQREHPNVWIRRGMADGRTYVVDVYRNSDVYYSVYRDQDDATPVLALGPRLSTVGEALAICCELAGGDPDVTTRWFALPPE